MGYLLISPLRRWFADKPETLLAPWLQPGMTVLEPGPGMGFFSLPMARMVSANGRVVTVDIQPQMLEGLRRRAVRQGLGEIIETRLAAANSLGIEDLAGQVEFVLAFAVVHEIPSAATFFAETAAAAKPGGKLLLAEPAGHVSPEQFAEELQLAQSAGWKIIDRPHVWRSQAALFAKN
jgi:ubiquinone/menaquinone biosynthesis C-methylase UbiE